MDRSRRVWRSAVAGAVLLSGCALGGPVARPESATESTSPPHTAHTTSTSVPTSTTVDPTSATTTAPPAAGCGRPESGVVEVSDGRNYTLRSTGPDQPTIGVVVLHGFQGSPELIEQTTGWTPFAESAGAVVAYPQGTDAGGGYFGWAAGTATYSTTGADDVGFLLEVIASLVADHCVDPARVLLTGESNGAAMSIATLCDDRSHGKLAMVAVAIAAVDDGTLGDCDASDQLPLVALAGQGDRTAPYAGHPAAAPTLLAQEDWFLRVAGAVNGCQSSPPARAPIDDGEVITPNGCAAETAMVSVADGVHTWPGGPVGTGGLDPGRFPGSTFIWERFGQVTGQA